MFPFQQSQNIYRKLTDSECLTEAERHKICKDSIINLLNAVPLPYKNKDMSNCLGDLYQMREELNGQSLFDFLMYNPNKFEEAIEQDVDSSDQVKDCLINEINGRQLTEDIELFGWLKPKGTLSRDNFFSHALQRSLEDESLKNHAQKIAEKLSKDKNFDEILFQSLPLMLECETTKKTIS